MQRLRDRLPGEGAAGRDQLEHHQDQPEELPGRAEPGVERVQDRDEGGRDQQQEDQRAGDVRPARCARRAAPPPAAGPSGRADQSGGEPAAERDPHGRLVGGHRAAGERADQQEQHVAADPRRQRHEERRQPGAVGAGRGRCASLTSTGSPMVPAIRSAWCRRPRGSGRRRRVSYGPACRTPSAASSRPCGAGRPGRGLSAPAASVPAAACASETPPASEGGAVRERVGPGGHLPGAGREAVELARPRWTRRRPARPGCRGRRRPPAADSAAWRPCRSPSSAAGAGRGGSPVPACGGGRRVSPPVAPTPRPGRPGGDLAGAVGELGSAWAGQRRRPLSAACRGRSSSLRRPVGEARAPVRSSCAACADGGQPVASVSGAVGSLGEGAADLGRTRAGTVRPPRVPTRCAIAARTLAGHGVGDRGGEVGVASLVVIRSCRLARVGSWPRRSAPWRSRLGDGQPEVVACRRGRRRARAPH